MAELINLIMVGIAVVCVVLAVGSRDRIRTLELRLALIERRFREGQAESSATPPAIPDARAERESSIVPAPPAVASEPVGTDAPPPPLPPIEPVSPSPVAAIARPSPSLEERFGTQWVVWAGGLAVACGGFFMLRLSIERAGPNVGG